MIYIGIDPGVSGGLAALSEAGRVIETWKMPDTDRDILDLLESITLHAGPSAQTGAITMIPCKAMIERVHTSPQMGVVSAGTFMGLVRALKMALTAVGIPYEEVTPQRWQKALGCLHPKGVGAAFGTKSKNITKSRAQALFPTLKITHAIADALLIAEYGRRLHRGILAHPSTDKGRNSEDHGKEEGRKEEGRKKGKARASVSTF